MLIPNTQQVRWQRTVLQDLPLVVFPHCLALKVCLRSLNIKDILTNTEKVYHRLGYHWATTLLALLTLVMAPFP